MLDSNFSFLEDHWGFLLEDAQRVEAFALRDPRTAAFYARRTLELALSWLFQKDTALKKPYEKSLSAMIHEPTFKDNIPRGLFQDIRTIHRLGNLSAHPAQPISSQEGMQICGAVHRFTGWLARVYTRDGPKPEQFKIALLPKAQTDELAETKQQAQATIVELQQVREQLAQRDEAERRAREQQEKTEAEVKELREQLALLQLIKQENTKQIPEEDYSEAETRELFIDVMLREAGWNPKGENVEEYEVHGMPNNKGIGYVDYVLWGEDGLPLAVVEAKKTKVDPKVGKHQAELYADCLEKEKGQRPVIFYTNGCTTWIWDDTEYPPREVQGFYTQDELQWIINRRTGATGKQDLTEFQPKTEITGRYYQMEAAARVMEAFQTERRRKALIVMATGTGKTRLSISIVDMMMRANWARRILFLADRRELVKQAKREFNKHLPHVTVASLLDPKQEDARIIFSTYPTMLNLVDGTKKDQSDTYSVGHFDLVIIDEAHRSVYQKYGAIFDYFDSLLIGLTATPRGEVDRNTYKLFELQDHQPTYAYELEQAVKDGFLVSPKAISVPLKFQREGIKYNELSFEEQEEYESKEQFYDEEGELKEEIGSAALNRWLFNADTIRKVLTHLMENGIKVEGGDKLGKTIIFAKSEKHASEIVKIFDQNYPHSAGHFCRKIDYSLNYAGDLIDKFKIKEKYPQIAVSVDMLDTGIDVPEVVSLVFFKLVRSKTKFWQMIGRGTRLCEDLFGPGEHKKEFIIFDYCQNLEFFDENPDGYESPAQEPIKQRIFKRRLEIALVLQEAKPEDSDLKDLEKALKDQLHTIVVGLNTDNFIVRKQRKTVEKYNDRSRWDQLGDKEIEDIENKLSGLPTAEEEHESARRFDLLVLNLMVAILQNTNRVEYYQKAIIDLAKNLEDKKSIPAVSAQMELILDLQTEAWWQDVNLPMLESVRVNLRDLVKFIDSDVQDRTTYTDFEDELRDKEVREHKIVTSDPNLEEYRERAERIIRSNFNHLTIRRLKKNIPISQTDIEALEQILFTDISRLSKERYHEAYGDKPLGLLVRSIVGLDRNVAKKAFAEFLEKTPLHPDQISFLNEVVEYLAQNGVVEPKELYETPFTHFHDQGLSGVMGDDLSKKVVQLVQKIKHNAEVA